MQCVQSGGSNSCSKANLSQPNGNSLNLIAWPFKCIRRRCQTSHKLQQFRLLAKTRAFTQNLQYAPVHAACLDVIFHWLNQRTSEDTSQGLAASWLQFTHLYRPLFFSFSVQSLSALLSVCPLGPLLLYYACGLYVFFICHVVLIGKPKLKLSLKNHNTTDDASSKMCPPAASGGSGSAPQHPVSPSHPSHRPLLLVALFVLDSYASGAFGSQQSAVIVCMSCVCVSARKQQQ